MKLPLTKEEAALRLSERMAIRRDYNGKMPPAPAGTADSPYAAWLEDQLVWSRTEGPLRQRNQAIDAATKRNETIAFLAADCSRTHSDNKRLRALAKDRANRIVTLQRRLEAERKRAAALELELQAARLRSDTGLLAAGAMVSPAERS